MSLPPGYDTWLTTPPDDSDLDSLDGCANCGVPLRPDDPGHGLCVDCHDARALEEREQESLNADADEYVLDVARRYGIRLRPDLAPAEPLDPDEVARLGAPEAMALAAARAHVLRREAEAREDARDFPPVEPPF